MKLTFRKAEGMVVVEVQGDVRPADRDRVEAEIDRHLEAGVHAFLIDARKGGLGYVDSHSYFLQAWLPVLKSRRARVAFLVPRQDERKPALRRWLENVGLVGTNKSTQEFWRILGNKGVINVFDDPEEANAFLRAAGSSEGN